MTEVSATSDTQRGLQVLPDPAMAVAGAVDDGAAALGTMRSQRSRLLKLALATSLVSRVLGALTSFVSVPLFIHMLGAEGYGLYESVGALAFWFGLSNAGLGLGLQNRLQDCHVSGDREMARRYVSSLSIALIAIASIVLVALSVAVFFVNWRVALPTIDPKLTLQTPWGVWVAAFITVLGVVVCVPYIAYAAQGEMHVANMWDAVSKLTTFSACLLVALWLGGGIVAAILAASGASLAVRIINAFWFFNVEKPWLRPSWAYFDPTLLKQLLGDGFLFFMLQIGTVLVFQVDKLIIGNRLGATEVAGYSALVRIFLTGYGLFMLFQNSLWPMYGEAIRRGDIAWARIVLRRMNLLGAGSMALCGLFMCLFHGPILRHFAPGADSQVTINLVLAVSAFFILRTWAESHSVPLNAAGVLRPQIVLLVTNGLLNLAVALLLVRPFGVVGVAWAFPLTAMLTTVWAYPWLVKRHMADPLPKAPGPLETAQ